MNVFNIVVLCTVYLSAAVAGAVLSDRDEIDEEGLYKKSDGVKILGQRNFNKLVYGQNYALVIQFYNSFCGHCRAFAPKYKSIAADVAQWKKVVQLAVVDCSVEENIDVCRQFDVLHYPSLRYLHENYVKGNSFIGDNLFVTDTPDKLISQIIEKMQMEQSHGRLLQANPLSIASYASYATALADVPNDIIYTFLIFENANSTVGSEVILDANEYKHIRVKRVFDNSMLAQIAGLKHFPGLVAVRSTLEPTSLTPKKPTRPNLIRAINIFLKSKDYNFPIPELISDERNKNSVDTKNLINADIVFYSDLERTLKTTLDNEIVRYQVLVGETLQALLDYLDVLIISFPFKANGKKFIIDLKNNVERQSRWNGADLHDLIKELERKHSPVYSSNLEYVACKGSQLNYRGYTCGLWTMFHTLTVNAANLPGKEGPKILRAMYGYVKNFFGCTECSQHFQAMADRNKLFEVNENEKAVIWLWIAHNEVNLRLAGDVTEDPYFPKIQFPRAERCQDCRLIRGGWNLSAIYRYLQEMYQAANIQERTQVSSPAAYSPFSNTDIGMLSLLYILSFVILILVIKLFLTKRFYRKRAYKHEGWGKV